MLWSFGPWFQAHIYWTEKTNPCILRRRMRMSPLTSPWEELVPGRNKPDFTSQGRATWYIGTYTGTPTRMQRLRAGGLGLGEVNEVQGFACAATNETPPCSWSDHWNLWEIWPLWNWGPTKWYACHSFALQNQHQRHQTCFFRVSMLWIIVRPFSFADY